jgi:hypothetical protein
MNEIRRMLDRQAAWQRARRNLPWPEKIRIAERMRRVMVELRRGETILPKNDERSNDPAN